MKGCFFLQRKFAYVGHAMAMRLRDRYGVAEFCGVASLRSSYDFLRSQRDIAYTDLLFEEEVYAHSKQEIVDATFLSQLEREIGVPNLWPFLKADRVITSGLLVRSYPYNRSRYSHEDMLKLLQGTAKAVSRFLDEQRPDYIVFSVVGNLCSLLLFHMAQKRGIKTFVIDCARIGNNYFFNDRYDHSGFVEEAMTSIAAGTSPNVSARREEARSFLRTYRARPGYYLAASESYAFFRPKTGFGHRIHKFLRAISCTIEAMWTYARNTHKDDYDVISPWWQLWDKIVKRWRLLRGYADLFEAPVAGERYAYFALHSEPESYPTVLAAFYTDQVWLAAEIARSLPVGMKLYIKDHPVMHGLRPRAYYRVLKKNPNVRLIDTRASGTTLTRGAELVMTLTGTTGWEAVLLGKPVIIFGNMYYDRVSAVTRCHSIEDLPRLIHERISLGGSSEEELIDFIAALLSQSVEIDLVQLWDIEGATNRTSKVEHVAPLVALLARHLGLPPSNV